MINRAFQYDLISNSWIEIEDKIFIDADIENLPVTLVVKNYDEIYIFCSKHKDLEKIKLVTPEEIISDNGCKFSGLYGKVVLEDVYHYYGYGIFVAYRWRIFQKSLQSPINISCDVSKMYPFKINHPVFWYNFGISVSTSKKICSITKLNTHHEKVNWTDVKNAIKEIKIPEIVTEVAIEVLRESTKAVYGIKPTVTTNVQGVTKILAYIERPFDLNIVFLKNFFKQFGDFDKIFPYDCKDNYKIICKLLEINPPKSLRKAYAQNPYAIIWYMLFKQLGIKDINFMQKFFYLDGDIGEWKLKDFFFNVKSKKVYLSDYKWRTFQYFLKWTIKNGRAKNFLKLLYRFVVEKLSFSDWEFDILDMFYKYDEKLSADLKKKILKSGLTGFIHDAVSYEVSEHLNKLEILRIIYDQKIMAYEVEINGYKFRAVRDTKDLYCLGLEMSNCVMTYRDKVLSRQSIIFCVIRKAKYLACIEIQNEDEIVQALGYHNQLLEGELLFICNFWAQLKNLKISTEQLNLPIKIIFDDVSIPKNLQNLICRIISD